MAIAIKGSYQVDVILDEGLIFSASYMEKILNLPIIITDHNGLIHYPNSGQLFVHYDDIVISIPLKPTAKDHYYDKASETLYYPVIHNGIIAYVVIKNLPANIVIKALEILSEANLAIKYYFCSLKKTQQNTLRIQNQLIDYLIYPDRHNIYEIVKQSGKSFNTELPFFAVVIDINGVIEQEDSRGKLCACSNEYLRRNMTDGFQLIFSNYLILIIADHFYDTDYYNNPNHSLLLKHKETLESNFNFSTSQGIGTSYPLSNIKRSFDEAMISQILPSLMGQKQYSQYFSKLGVFTHIFKQDFELLSNYCLKTLSPLIDYDKNNNTCLLDTLRHLLDHSFNYKTIAQNLYIHINTLYYRINKIQELLGMDISHMHNRVNIYTSVKVWDTLSHLNYLKFKS